MFRIKDRVFNVQEATIGAEIRQLEEAKMMWGDSNNGLAWDFQVIAEEREFEGETWGARVFRDSLSLELGNWTELEGVSIEWEDGFDEELYTYNCGIYVFGLNTVYDCHVAFGECQGNTFAFEWQGLCEVFADDDYGTDVPFQIETNISFSGIKVYAVDPQTASDMLAQFFDPQDFIQHEVDIFGHFDDGRPMGIVLFEPKSLSH